MTILDILKKDLFEIIKDLGYVSNVVEKDFDFSVSFIDETNRQYGDISTNLPIILSKKINQNLSEIAEKIKEKFLEIYPLEKIELAKNGFLNIFMSDEILNKELKNIQDIFWKKENQKIFLETNWTKKNILLEHTSPNLFKPFHIGHLMNNAIGESLASMMRASDANLKTMSFPSDISLGIAKAIYMLKESYLKDEFEKIKKLFLKNEEDISIKNILIDLFGRAYFEGVGFYEENLDKQDEIKKIAKNLFEKNKESEDYEIFEFARDLNIDYFKRQLKDKLNTQIDKYIFESDTLFKAEEIIKENINKDKKDEVFIMSDGAIVFDTKKRKNKESNETIKSVFINSEGHPTYQAKDLGLLALKKDYFDFDKSIFVTDNEQIPHFEVVMQAAKELGSNLKNIAENSIHIAHGRLELNGKRMASREGNTLSVDGILDILQANYLDKFSKENGDINIIDSKNIILACLKIAILKSKIGLNVDFDLEKDFSFTGNTGAYLLYTFVRGNKLIQDFQKISPENNIENIFNLENIKITKENKNFILNILQSETILKNSINNLAPQGIVRYLFDLAGSFNNFYDKQKILDKDNLSLTQENIYLVQIFLKTFKFALNILGIKEVEEM